MLEVVILSIIVYKVISTTKSALQEEYYGFSEEQDMF